MQFVNEHDDLPGTVSHSLQHFLQSLFKLAAVFSAGHQGSQIQRIQSFILQAFGYIACHDTTGQSFHNGSLADTGLADEHRIILLPAAQDLNGPADLIVTADNRIQLALPGPGGQVLPELFQCLFAFVIGRAVEVMLVQLFDFAAVNAILFKQSRYIVAAVAGKSGGQMTDSHVPLPCLAQHHPVDAGKVRAHEQLPVLSFHRRNTADQRPCFIGKSVFIHFKCLQQKLEELIVTKSQQQMRAGHFLIVIHQSLLLRRFNDGLYFIHIVFVHTVSLLLQNLPAQAGTLKLTILLYKIKKKLYVYSRYLSVNAA